MVTTLLLLAVLASPDAVQERFSAAKPAAATPTVAEFERYLSGLGHGTIASVAPARAALEERMAKVSPHEAEDLVRLFWRWHERLVEASMSGFLERRDLQEALSLVQSLAAGPVWNRPLDRLASAPRTKRDEVRRSAPAAFRELERYRAAGCDFAYAEGGWYLATDPRFITQVAGSLPDGSLKAYLAFRAREDDGRVAHDGGLVVSWDGLRRRLARWEAFGRTHAQLPEAKGPIEREVRWLARWYLLGGDNTPAFDYETKRLDPELRKSYERFLAEDSSSAYHSVVTAAWAVLQKNGFRPTRELVSALRARLTHPDFRWGLEDLERQLRGRRP